MRRLICTVLLLLPFSVMAECPVTMSVERILDCIVIEGSRSYTVDHKKLFTPPMADEELDKNLDKYLDFAQDKSKNQ